MDPSVPSTITAFPAGWIDKELEVVVGLQTDKPLKRAIKPLGGINMVTAALESYGFTPDPEVERIYTQVGAALVVAWRWRWSWGWCWRRRVLAGLELALAGAGAGGAECWRRWWARC